MATRRVKRRARKSRTRRQRGGLFAKWLGFELTNDSALALLKHKQIYPSVDTLIQHLHQDLFTRYNKLFPKQFLRDKGVSHEYELKDYQKTQLAEELELGIAYYTYNPALSTREKFERLIRLRSIVRELTSSTSETSIDLYTHISIEMKDIRREIQRVTSQTSQVVSNPGLPPGWSKQVTNSGDTYYEHTDGRTEWDPPT
jgi:hypothetical protein